MKQLIRFGIVSSLIVSGSAFSLEPIQGWYVGINAGVTGAASTTNGIFSFTYPTPPLMPQPSSTQTSAGTINNNVIGGGMGANVGYRLNQLRLEGEVFYNYMGTRTLSLGDCTLESPSVPTPTANNSNCANSGTVVNALSMGFKGSTGAAFGLFNVYYDFFSATSSQDDNPIVPYIGLGIGASRIQRSINFVATNNYVTSLGGNTHTDVPAGQFIVGASYFMDDYAWIQMDYRFTGTGSFKATTLTSTNSIFSYKAALEKSSNYYLNALMFTVNFSFDNASLNGPNH